MTTRGVRNNNPGNIRHGEAWKGLSPTQTDPQFLQFSSPEYGIRAIARILRSYHKWGCTTITQIVDRWAPPIENDTPAYIKSVAWQCNMDANVAIDLETCMLPLVKAIIEHENGTQPYPDDLISKGIALAERWNPLDV